MRVRLGVSLLVLLGSTLPDTAGAVANQGKKQTAVAAVQRHQGQLVALADEVWSYAETALRETRSSEALAKVLEAEGFRVQRGVAEMPTAFVAEFGSGKPILGILGEYDALPGVSQKAQATREELTPGAAGHACGHNLLGVGSLGAALAIREMIAAGQLAGTIRYYGTPAEEAVGGKVYMLRAGVFDDLEVCLAWHPDAKTHVDTESSQAIVDLMIEFKGRAAHAALDPWNGRSAQDGLEVLTYSINLMREHVKPSVRLHYAVVEGAKVPNVVPDRARLWLWVRDKSRDGVEDVLQRVRKAAEGAALCADVESELRIQTGDYELLVNMNGARLLQTNLDWLGPVPFNAEDQEFARAIQGACNVEPKGLTTAVEPFNDHPGDPEGGSSDVGDVSWKVPVLHVSVATAPLGTPWHAWPVVACGGGAVGHRGMLHASKVLAATLVDLYENSKQRQAIQEEFASKTAGQVYKGYIPDGPPPLPQP